MGNIEPQALRILVRSQFRLTMGLIFLAYFVGGYLYVPTQKEP